MPAGRWLLFHAAQAAALPDLQQLCVDCGALESSLDGARLQARFAEREPGHLEDRVEAWLDLFAGPISLQTSADGETFLPGWRAIYRGIDVAGFRVRPPWAAEERAARQIVIDPCGGFGSGQHPSTRLALAALADVAQGRAGATLLDVGAGTGILAIAAAQLGLRPTAIDSAPRAREACARTAAQNGVALRVSAARLEELGEKFDVVVANVPAKVLIALAPALARSLAEDGTLIVSGAWQSQLAAVLAALPLTVRTPLSSDDGEWAGAILSR